jgi:hypothetical protein
MDEQQEPDGNRNRQRDGNAPYRFRNDAVECSALCRHFDTFTPYRVRHTANNSSAMFGVNLEHDISIGVARLRRLRCR